MNQTKKLKIIIIAIAIFAVAGLAAFIAWPYLAAEPPSDANLTVGQLSGEPMVGSEVPEGVVVPTEPPKISNLTETYENTKYKFSFQYPKGYSINAFSQEAEVLGEPVDVVLLQKSGENTGFQIFITPFDEPEITPQRVLDEIPDMLVENPVDVLIGAKKDIKALIFISDKEGIGDTREVWLIHKGYLYQISTYAVLDNFIGPILDTLAFK